MTAILDPSTRSRTLLFLSIRDSRTPSAKRKSNFTVYDEEDEDEDHTAAESANLLGSSQRNKQKHKHKQGAVAIEIGSSRAEENVELNLPGW